MFSVDDKISFLDCTVLLRVPTIAFQKEQDIVGGTCGDATDVRKYLHYLVKDGGDGAIPFRFNSRKYANRYSYFLKLSYRYFKNIVKLLIQFLY